MVTYEQLFDALRREKSREELQALDAQFYVETRRFLSDKERESSAKSAGTLAGQRAQVEYHNAKRIIRELYDRRERKIVTLALHKTRTDAAVIDAEALLPEERTFLDRIVGVMQESRSDVLGPSSEPPEPPRRKPEPPEPAEEPAGEKPSDDKIGITFLEDVPKFVGKDLSVFGPYKEGDAARLPGDVAEILVKKGRAETDQHVLRKTRVSS